MALRERAPTTRGMFFFRHVQKRWSNERIFLTHPEQIAISTSFLEGPKAALVASKDFHDGHYTSPPQAGIRAFGRVYSAWAYSQTVRLTPQTRRERGDFPTKCSTPLTVTLRRTVVPKQALPWFWEVHQPQQLPPRRVGRRVPNRLGCERSPHTPPYMANGRRLQDRRERTH